MKVGLLVCGAPGVGKTTHLSQILKYAKLSGPLEKIDPDKIEHTSYEKRAKIALEHVYSAIEKGENFVYTVTCGSTKRMKKIIDAMKDKKYKIILSITYASKHTALRRVLTRTEQPVHQDIAKELYDYFKRHAAYYMTLPEIDDVFLYDNETDFSMILHKHKKKITCHHLSEFYFDISEYCS